jgi:hypothetical protein
MAKLSFALLVDVDNVAMDAVIFESIINQVSILGDIVYGKVYGYSDRKHSKLNALISKNGFNVTNTMRLKKRGKSELDLRLVIDAVKLACENQSINGFCLVAGSGDLIPLISMLRSMGKAVVGGFAERDENSEMCDRLINVRMDEVLKRMEAGFKAPPVSKTPKTYSEEHILEDLEALMNTKYIPAKKNKTESDVFSELEQLAKTLMKNNEN